MQKCRRWAGDVVVVVRRSWRPVSTVVLITMVLPAWPVYGLIAHCAMAGLDQQCVSRRLPGTGKFHRA